MDIVLQNVSKSYAGRQVLRDISCRIPEGAICAVLAPSGVGKTTLLRLILELEKPDSGIISGIPAKKAALFQEDRLCPNLSVPANIRMAVPKASKGEIQSILTELGLGDSLTKPVSALSGGMARRAALARALLGSGELLTLDEPFTGLDEENRLLAAKAILNHRRGRTTILVTHRHEDLELLGVEQIIQLEAE